MTTSNGADNIRLLNRKYNKTERELSLAMKIFLNEKTAKEMLNAKGDVDKLMLELVELERKIEYAELGWK